MITLKITNKWLYSILAIIILLCASVLTWAYTQSIPNPGHGGDEILVEVDVTEMTLQQAINELSNREVMVTVDGTEMTFEEFANQLSSGETKWETCNNGICSSNILSASVRFCVRVAATKSAYLGVISSFGCCILIVASSINFSDALIDNTRSFKVSRPYVS